MQPPPLMQSTRRIITISSIASTPEVPIGASILAMFQVTDFRSEDEAIKELSLGGALPTINPVDVDARCREYPTALPAVKPEGAGWH